MATKVEDKRLAIWMRANGLILFALGFLVLFAVIVVGASRFVTEVDGAYPPNTRSYAR